MNYINTLQKNLTQSIAAKQQLLTNDLTLSIFAQAVEVIISRYKQGGRLYIAGNGGSAADAQHLAAEFVSKLAQDRAPLPAEALTVDSSILTAIGNDYGYDQLFARQLLGKATKKDVFLGITTSGRSPNILKALEQANQMGIPSIVLCGKNGGSARDLAEYCIIAPGTMTSTIQELHIVLLHSICECVEQELCINNKVTTEEQYMLEM